MRSATLNVVDSSIKLLSLTTINLVDIEEEYVKVQVHVLNYFSFSGEYDVFNQIGTETT